MSWILTVMMFAHGPRGEIQPVVTQEAYVSSVACERAGDRISRLFNIDGKPMATWTCLKGRQG